MCVLASGSAGNCTYIGDGHAGVLVDCGPSTKQILKRMEASGLGDAPIDAVLITHEHGDHVGAAGVLSRRLKKITGRHIPFFMTAGTRGNLKPQVTPERVELIEAGQTFKVGHLEVEAFRVPHDTPDPVAYRVCASGTWAGVITDLGRPTQLVAEKLRSMDMAVLEFNHDVDMLLDGPYPWPLKQRIRSSHGHLSNVQAATLLDEGLGAGLEHLVLAHLSEENNAPKRALAAAMGVLHEKQVLGKVQVQVGLQKDPLPPVAVRVSEW